MKNTMDQVDEKIISLMQDNARISIKDIAAQVYLSSPAVTARIDRLEQRGVISGYHAYVNPEAVGYRVKAFINVDVDPVREKDFYPFVEGCRSVLECNCVTGEYAMLLEVAFRDNTNLNEFIHDLQQFGRTKTQVVFSTSVEHRNPPLDT